MTSGTRDGNGRFARDPETAKRDAEAAQLRSQNLSYRQIAVELGVSVHTAYDAVQRAIEDTQQEPAAATKLLELERLDELAQKAREVMGRRHIVVSNGKVIYDPESSKPLEDDAPVLQAVDRLLRIQERRSKLLGLDAETKVSLSGGVTYEIVGIDPTEIVGTNDTGNA